MGDKNDKFSINQFINYGIDGKHPIGLSSFDRNKALAIFIPTELIPDASSADGWTAVKIIGTGTNEDSVDTLKLFYTNISNAINAPDVSSLTIPADGLKLRLQYKDTVENYVIFDFVVGSAQVTVGSRPLGLRKHGIIVNPTSANEDLLPGIAEKIHVTLEGTATTGKAIQIIAHNNVGAELDTCNIEYKTDKNGEAAGFYFDGVNLSELNIKTDALKVSTENLQEKVDDNTANITDIIEGINNATYDSKRGDSSSKYKCYQAVFSSQLQKNVTKTGTITVSNVPTNAKYTYIIDTHITDGVASYLSDGNISASLDTTRNVTVSGTTHTVPYTCKYDETNDTNDWCEFQVRCYVFSHKITI